MPHWRIYNPKRLNRRRVFLIDTLFIAVGNKGRLDAELLAIIHETHLQAAPVVVFRDKPKRDGVSFMVFARVLQKGVSAVGKALVDIVFADWWRFKRELLPNFWG
jgi:hypothetical protein